MKLLRRALPLLLCAAVLTGFAAPACAEEPVLPFLLHVQVGETETDV